MKKTNLTLFTLFFNLLSLSFVVPFANAAAGWNQMYLIANKTANPSTVIQTTDGGFAIAGVTSYAPNDVGSIKSDLCLVKTDAFGNMQWNQTYGGTRSEGLGRVPCLVQTDDGGYALLGDTSSFGAGSDDFYLVKTDSLGRMIWNKTYGDTGQDDGLALVKTNDGGYVMGGDTGGGSGWLIKADSEGRQLWNQTFIGKVQWTPALNQSYFNAYNALIEQYGSNQTLLSQLLKELAYNYTKVWGGGKTIIMSIDTTSDGGFVLAGQMAYNDGDASSCWLVKTNSTGHLQWVQTYGVNSTATSIIQTTDGGYALSAISFNQRINPNIFNSSLYKTDSAGNLQWNKTYNTFGAGLIINLNNTYGYVTEGGDLIMNSSKAWSVVQSSDGGYALAGSVAYTQQIWWKYDNTTDKYWDGPFGPFFWLVKADSTGNMQWSQVFVEPWLDYWEKNVRSSTEAHSLVQTNDGAYALVGPAGSGMWLVKTDTTVIPEFPSLIAIPALIIMTMVAVFVHERIPRKYRVISNSPPH